MPTDANSIVNHQRRVLAKVARRELFRDCYGRLWEHVSGGTQEGNDTTSAVLLALEEDGMVVCPPKVEDERVDRYYDLTDKALEA